MESRNDTKWIKGKKKFAIWNEIHILPVGLSLSWLNELSYLLATNLFDSNYPIK